jgi:hypothetical protein
LPFLPVGEEAYWISAKLPQLSIPYESSVRVISLWCKGFGAVPQILTIAALHDSHNSRHHHVEQTQHPDRLQIRQMVSPGNIRRNRQARTSVALRYSSHRCDLIGPPGRIAGLARRLFSSRQ